MKTVFNSQSLAVILLLKFVSTCVKPFWRKFYVEDTLSKDVEWHVWIRLLNSWESFKWDGHLMNTGWRRIPRLKRKSASGGRKPGSYDTVPCGCSWALPQLCVNCGALSVACWTPIHSQRFYHWCSILWRFVANPLLHIQSWLQYRSYASLPSMMQCLVLAADACHLRFTVLVFESSSIVGGWKVRLFSQSWRTRHLDRRKNAVPISKRAAI